MVGPVDLEHGARSGGLAEHELPVEVEVVARLDHPARRVGDDVDVGQWMRGQGALGELRPRGWRRETWSDATTTS